MSLWRFEVRGPDGTPKATLDPTLGSTITQPKFRHPQRGIGSGEFYLQNDDPDIGDIEDGDIVHCFKDDTPVFAWIISTRLRHSVAKAAAAGVPSGEKYTQFAGLSTKAIGARSFIGPLRGGTAKPKEKIRPFDWTSPLYDFSAWPAATQIARVDSLTTAHWVGYPEFYPDNLIYWIAGDDGTDDDAVEGVRLFRAPRITLAAETVVSFFAWIDNEGFVYLNGTEILAIDTFHTCRQIDLRLPAGTYDVAVFDRNLTPIFSNVDNNPVGIGFGAYARNGSAFTERILVSDDSWSVLVLPDELPGLPLGRAIRQLTEESQGRGEIPGVTLGITDTEDTLGEDLPADSGVAAVVGDSWTDYMLTLEESVIDWEMDPDSLEVRIFYPRGSSSVDRTGGPNPVSFTDGVSLRKLDHETRDDRLDRLLIDYDGGYLELGTGEFSRVLRLQQVVSDEAATRIGIEVLSGRSVVSTRYAADIHTTEGREPYDDFDPGDLVFVDQAAGGPAPQPAQAVTFAVDRAGRPVWAVEFGDILEPLETIADRAIKRYAATRGATNLTFGNPIITAAGGSEYRQQVETFSYEPSDLQISQRTSAQSTRDIAYLQVDLDEADGEDHDYIVKVNGTTLTGITVTVPAGQTYGREWADIAEYRVIAPIDKITLEFTGSPHRFIAKLALR